MKITLKDNTEIKIQSYENKESSVLFYIWNMTFEDAKARFTESNTEEVNVFNDLDEQVASYKGYVLGSKITFDTDANIIEISLEEKATRKLVEQNTADITAINEAIASLAEIVGGE
nr:MAG TPA: hypothetical protein [Caudoviricetes sp.]